MSLFLNHPWVFGAFVIGAAGIAGCCLGWLTCDFLGMFNNDDEDHGRLYYPRAFEAEAHTAGIRRTFIYDQEAE